MQPPPPEMQAIAIAAAGDFLFITEGLHDYRLARGTKYLGSSHHFHRQIVTKCRSQKTKTGKKARLPSKTNNTLTLMENILIFGSLVSVYRWLRSLSTQRCDRHPPPATFSSSAACLLLAACCLLLLFLVPLQYSATPSDCESHLPPRPVTPAHIPLRIIRVLSSFKSAQTAHEQAQRPQCRSYL